MLLTSALSVVLCVLLFWSLDWHDVADAFHAADPAILALGLLAYAGSYACRALRFRLLLYSRRPALNDLLGVVAVHNLLNMLLPVRTGELSYVVLANRRYGVSLGEAAASLLVARLYDMFGIAVLFMAALIAHRAALGGEFGNLLLLGGGLAALSLLALLLLVPAVKLVHRMIHARLVRAGWSHRPAVARAMAKGDALVGHLEEIRARRSATHVFLVTEAQWLMTFLTCYSVLRALDIAFPFDASVLGSTGLSIALILPINTFANVGTFEAGWVAGYVLAGMPRADATTSAIVAHVFIMLFAVLLALLARCTLLRRSPLIAAPPA